MISRRVQHFLQLPITNSPDFALVVFASEQPSHWRGMTTTALARFNYLMAALLGSMALLDIFFVQTIRSERMRESIATFPGLIPLIVVACFCHWMGYPRIRDVLLSVIWPVALSLVTSPLLEMSAGNAHPLVDTALAQIDAGLFQTVSVVQWLQHFHALAEVFRIAYGLSVPLIILALVLPVFCGHSNSARRFIFGASVALAITISLFALWPAAGPWTFEDFQPSERQEAAASYLLALKSHHPNAVPSQLGNIVSFPSFHTITAILSAAALWKIRWIRWIVLAVCIGITISTVTTGWHYVIDVAGGIGVAFAAWAAALLIRE